jgi:hypothetical protein
VSKSFGALRLVSSAHTRAGVVILAGLLIAGIVIVAFWEGRK